MTMKWILGDAIVMASYIKDEDPSADIDRLVNEIWKIMDRENQEEYEGGH